MREFRRPDAMIDDVLAIPDHLRDALWRVESARLEAAEAEGLLVCGHGRLGDRRRPRRRRARRPPDAAAHVGRGYPLPSWATPPGRSSAGATRATPRRRSLASGRRRLGARGWSPAPAARSSTEPARTASRSSACPGSSSRAPPSPTCSPWRPRWRRWSASRRGSPRDRGRRRLARAPDASSSRHRRPRSPHSSRATCRRLRRRTDRAGRAPLEDPGQREREAAGLLPRAARGRPQRDLRLGRAREHRLAAVFLEDRDAHPRVRALPADRRGDRPSGAEAVRIETAGETPHRAPFVDDDARRPGLARAGRRARRRSAPGRGARPAEGRPRR